MKKTLLVGFLLAIAAARAMAASPVSNYGASSLLPAAPANIVTTVKSSTTFTGVSAASQTATSVVLDQTQMWRWVEVQNFDTTSPVVCGENALTISTITASLSGYVVAAWANLTTQPPSKKFDIPPASNFFCQCTKTIGGCRVGLSWGR